VFLRVTLPHLLPALMAGWLVVGLYTIGDFGAVALMRYEVFSYAIYIQYSAAFDRLYAAWLALILIAIALSRGLVGKPPARGAHYARTGSGSRPRPARLRLGPRGQALGWGSRRVVVLASLGLPVAVLTFWMTRAGRSWPIAARPVRAFGQSLSVAVPAAVLAAAMALPVAVLAVRYPSPLSTLINRLAFVGYAVPALAFALAFVFFALHGARFLYQTHLAAGDWSMRSASWRWRWGRSARRSTTRARRSRRRRARWATAPVSTFWRVTLPTIRPGVVAGMVLVFVIAMKELPIAFLLAPTGFRPLAITMFSRTSEGMLIDAAPYAAAIIAFSALFVGFVLRHDRKAGRMTDERDCPKIPDLPDAGRGLAAGLYRQRPAKPLLEVDRLRKRFPHAERGGGGAGVLRWARANCWRFWARRAAARPRRCA
jgi:iron(III) transport system permease protein